MIRQLRGVGLVLFVLLAQPAWAATGLEIWLTTGNQTALLERQPTALTLPGGGLQATRIQVDAGVRYQVMEGFGAALTDAAAWNIQYRLTPDQRDALMTSLFSPTDGIGISYLRVPVGSSDYSKTSYTYNDMPAGQQDPNLDQFSIAHDLAYIIPQLKQATTLNPQLKIMASPWSPPAWMKTPNVINGGSMNPTYYPALANYFVKFVQAYEAEGVPIDAITIQNEPQHVTSGMPSMGMSASEQALFIRDHLGPAFASQGITTKILAWDHNWDNTDFATIVLGDPGASPYVAGTAWHAYGGQVSAQTTIHNAFPDKDIYFTEISSGDWAVKFGDNLTWNYRNIFIGATTNWAKTALLWNLALDENNGPTIGGAANCRGVVTISSTTGEITLNQEYYAIGHSSKFVQPGAVRINSTTWPGSLDTVAYLNPDGSETVLAANSGHLPRTFDLVRQGEYFTYTIPPQSVATFVYRRTLTWDGRGNGQWDDSDPTGNARWLDGTTSATLSPDTGMHAVIKANMVTVAAEHGVRSMGVTSGGLNVTAEGSLSVVNDLTVAAGAALSVAGRLSADSLTLSGATTVAPGAQLSIGSNLTLATRLDLTGATMNTVADRTHVRVAAGGDLVNGGTLVGSRLSTAGRVQTAGVNVDRIEVTGSGRLTSSSRVAAELVSVTSGALTLAAGAPLIATHVNVSGGTVTLGDRASVETLEVRNALVDTGGRPINVERQMQLGDVRFAIDPNHSFEVAPDAGRSLLTGHTVTLRGGQMTLSRANASIRATAAGAWTFDRVVGTTAINEGTAGSAADAVLSGGVTLIPRQGGNAVSLDGRTGQIIVPDLSQFEFAAEQSFTLSLWYRHSLLEDDYNGLITKGYNASTRADNFYLLQVNPGGQASLHTRPTSGWTPNVLFADPKRVVDDLWHQITVVRDSPGNEFRLYVDDGAPTVYSMGTGDQNGDWKMGVNDLPLVIGNHYGRFTAGEFDDVLMFRRPLSRDEITALWVEGSGSAATQALNMQATSFQVMADTALHLESLGPTALGNIAVVGGATLAVSGAPLQLVDLAGGDGATVAADVRVSGHLSLSDAPGTLSILGNLALDDDARYAWRPGSSNADLVAVSGNLDLSQDWILTLLDQGVLGADRDLVVFTYGTLAEDSLDAYAIDASAVGHWTFAEGGPWLENDVAGHRIVLRGVVAVPEANAAALVLIALASCWLGSLGHRTILWRRSAG
jgi:glucosylceramidase